MEVYDKIIELVMEYWYVAALVLEIGVFRLVKSDKVRSVFRVIAVVLDKTATFTRFLADSLDKVIPDRTPTE